MDRLSQIEQLNQMLLAEMPAYRPWAAEFQAREGARRLLRALMNIRPPLPLDPDFLRLQDALLSAEREERGVVDAAALPEVPAVRGSLCGRGTSPGCGRMLSSTPPTPPCWAVSTPATGASTTPSTRRRGSSSGTHVPASWRPRGTRSPPVGPSSPGAVISPPGTSSTRWALSSPGPSPAPTGRPWPPATRACLSLAAEHGLHSVAFCCISTGEFRFPPRGGGRDRRGHGDPLPVPPHIHPEGDLQCVPRRGRRPLPRLLGEP